MRFVIVTGVSGAGKTSALKMLEDAKYFCVDNLPIPLLEKFASLMPEIHGEDVQNVALGIDARSGRSLDELEIVLDRMKKAGYDFEILFLDAQDSVLVKRYKETRRSHPLAMGGRVDDGIRMEREKMRFLKERADYIIDTSNLLTRELKQEIDRIFVDNQDFCNMMISVLSFGFKYNCNEKSHKRISQALRQYCEQNQTCSRHCMCQDHRCTITYSVHKSNRCQIYQQLDPEIKSNQKCDLLQRNPVTALKCQKQQRNEIVHNGLHYISDKTGLHCSVVICFHPMLYPPI